MDGHSDHDPPEGGGQSHLKGTAFCIRCEERFGLSPAKGGAYWYFYCSGRHRGTGCDPPYVPIDEADELAAEAYSLFPTAHALELHRDDLKALLDANAAERKREADVQRRRLLDLKDQSTKLLRAHMADAVPLDVMKTEQDRIRQEQAQVEEVLAGLETDHSQVLATFDKIVKLLASLSPAVYRSLQPASKRTLNQTFMQQLLIDHRDHGRPVLRFTELGQVIDSVAGVPPSQGLQPGRTLGSGSVPDAKNPQLTGVATGSSNARLERVTGIEPAL
ncbi:zinc ribbon domain-containing protein [Streptomyces sp. NPDC001415]